MLPLWHRGPFGELKIMIVSFYIFSQMTKLVSVLYRWKKSRLVKLADSLVECSDSRNGLLICESTSRGGFRRLDYRQYITRESKIVQSKIVFFGCGTGVLIFIRKDLPAKTIDAPTCSTFENIVISGILSSLTSSFIFCGDSNVDMDTDCIDQRKFLNLLDTSNLAQNVSKSILACMVIYWI